MASKSKEATIVIKKNTNSKKHSLNKKDNKDA